jgi:geranylgeranyl pyrophosphate synthase
MSPVEIENTLRLHLKKFLPKHASSEIYHYATLPGGKLFRPCLIWSVLQDLNPVLYERTKNNPMSSHALLASAIEFHHSYTLIHDDLPCMDDDVTRRGKPSTHMAFGEWQALLAGDGLLNLSYELIIKSNNHRTLELLRFFTWAVGPKGLIHGQVMDLSKEMTLSFENTMRTHELKTARLIQVAVLGSTLFSGVKNYPREKNLWKYSKLLGINFQLIDDLSELVESDLSEHENEVNPWLHFTEKAFQETVTDLAAFNNLSSQLILLNTNKIVANYYKKMLEVIVPNQVVIEGHLKNRVDISPIISSMQNFS